MVHRTQGPVAKGIPHVSIGATALFAHGYRRMTEDVNVCLRKADLERFKRDSVGSLYEPVEGRARRFYDPKIQVTIEILIAGEIAGNTRKQREVTFPDPSEAHDLDGIAVPSLARLIELKLVTWRLRDWADVIELIRVHNLDESFGDQFNPLVRSTYIRCFDQKTEEDRYNPEIHDRHPDEPQE